MTDQVDGYWIGHPGALLPLPDVQGSFTRKVERAVSYKTSAGGRRRAYLAARRAPLREWTITIPELRPDEAAPLHALLMGTDPPYVWIDPWSLVTNLLTPSAAGLEGVLPALEPLGRQPLADGGWAAVAGQNPGGGEVNIPPAPVVPGMPVTVSAYLGTEDSATVTAVFLDSNGAEVGDTTTSAAVTGIAALYRASVTVTDVPLAAVAVYIRVTGASVIAQPAVTWTSELVEYGPGGGAAQVIVTGLDESIQWAMRNATGHRWADMSFTVTEVG